MKCKLRIKKWQRTKGKEKNEELDAQCPWRLQPRPKCDDLDEGKEATNGDEGDECNEDSKGEA